MVKYKVNIDDLTKYELLDSKGWTLKPHIKTKVMEELNIEGEKEVKCVYLNMDQISKEITDQNLYRGVIWVIPELRFTDWWKRLDQNKNIMWTRIKEDRGPVLQDEKQNTIGIEVHNLYAIYIKEEEERQPRSRPGKRMTRDERRRR